MHHGPVSVLHEALGLGIITAVALTVFALAEVLKAFTSFPTEWTRKLAHTGAGGAVLLIPVVIDSHWTVAIVAGGFALLMVVTSSMGLLSSVHGVGRGVGGVLWYPFTAWLLYFTVFNLLDEPYVMYAIPVLVLATADALGALVGKSYGRLRYRVTEDHQRSIEGTLAVFGTVNFWTMVVALTIASWFTTARVMRGQIITLKQNDYVRAAYAVGAKGPRVLYRHLLMNTLGVIIVFVFLELPGVILGEAFLSFLGLGINPPKASWGTLAQDGYTAYATHPYIIVIPSICIAWLILSAFFIADGLRDALDPRTKEA